MVQPGSEHLLDGIEGALRQAAHRYKATIEGMAHVGQYLRERAAGEDAISFSIAVPELYGALLEAEIRLSVFLPCRIVAYTRDGRVELETVSPVDFCRVLNRPDLAPLVIPVENLLRKIMKEAATPLAAVSRTVGTQREGLGATEEQMNTRGAIPQRIDSHGTKVEELGGTGELDSKGG
jgi:hypothetical protein